MEKVISIDCETNGLYGECFAVGCLVYENGIKTAEFSGRCSDDFVVDDWVIKNVLPALGDMPVTTYAPKELRRKFWNFWMENKEGAIVIAHMGHPVETGFFKICVMDNVVGRQWEGPSSIHDVATILTLIGENPYSVDEYVKKYELSVGDGFVHNPLYDSEVAYVVWKHANENLWRE